MMTRLDNKGRCCGRKPVEYKRPPHLFCTRCDRSFDPVEGWQIPNWAWVIVDGEFQPKSSNGRAALAQVQP